MFQQLKIQQSYIFVLLKFTDHFDEQLFWFLVFGVAEEQQERQSFFRQFLHIFESHFSHKRDAFVSEPILYEIVVRIVAAELKQTHMINYMLNYVNARQFVFKILIKKQTL